MQATHEVLNFLVTTLITKNKEHNANIIFYIADNAIYTLKEIWGFPRTRLPMQETQEMRIRSLCQEDPLE